MKSLKFSNELRCFFLFVILTFFASCSDHNTKFNENIEFIDTLVHKEVEVDSSKLILVKYGKTEGNYYNKETYGEFRKWFGVINKTYAYEPDVAHEIYMKYQSKEKNHVPGGPAFYYLYAYLLQERNGIEKNIEIRERYTSMFLLINAVFKNLHSDGSYNYFSYQTTAINAYAEFAVYNYKTYNDLFVKSYSVDIQKDIYLNGLRQKIEDELGEIEKVKYSQYAELNEAEKKEHKEFTLLFVNKLDTLIKTPFDLHIAQEFQYSHYN